MNICKLCRGPAIPLFTGFACKNECDLPEPEAKRDARIARALAAESSWILAVGNPLPSFPPYPVVPGNGPFPFSVGDKVILKRAPPDPLHATYQFFRVGEVAVIEHAHHRMTVAWGGGGVTAGLDPANYRLAP